MWPEVDVTFSDNYSDLIRDGIDVAIRISGHDNSRLMRKVLAPHRLLTCATPAYLQRKGVTAFLVGEQIRTGTLIPVLEDFYREESPICAVYPSKRHLSPKVRTFIDEIEKRWCGQYVWKLP